VERLFSYWNQHLPNLKTKKYNERMYNFLEDDLRKLYEAVGEGNMEEVERFFSYWGTHLKALDPKGGVFEYNEGGKIISVPENLTDEDILKLAETTKSEINDDLSKLYPQRDFCGMAIKSGDKSKETRAKFDDLTNRILYIQNIEKSIDEIISKYKKSKGGGVEQSFKVGDSVVINDPKDPINGCSGKVVGFYGEGKQKHAEVKLTSVPPNSVFNKGDVELIRLKHLRLKKG
jgi:hypothetical protein